MDNKHRDPMPTIIPPFLNSIHVGFRTNSKKWYGTFYGGFHP